MSKQIILDYQEFLDMQSELDALRKPADGAGLTEAEHQEATGILLIRAIQNPDVFRRGIEPVELGKFRAIFVVTSEQHPGVRVKFERT